MKKKSSALLDVETINKLKIIMATSLASDDELLEMLILKGGNAISLGYGLSDRPSYDLDYSMEDDFQQEIEEVAARVEKLLRDGFAVHGYELIDFKFLERPKTQEFNKDFWGGYKVEFKIVEEEEYRKVNNDIEEARRSLALRLTPGASPVFSIDISKFEYIDTYKQQKELEGMTYYVYAPELIVAEKLRALCQKLPEYNTEILGNKAKDKSPARARDFFDIYIMTQEFDFDPSREDLKQLIKQVFDAKRVPYNYIKQIRGMKDVHRLDYESLKDTITDKEAKEKGFDFYFDYTMGLFENIFD
ncbi:MAG: hypothetical protein EOO43_02910 [Flavobacterium sp.]|nr:MAG: hypothetical protein EOO43_02910 [Flavobacterium sp.]